MYSSRAWLEITGIPLKSVSLKPVETGLLDYNITFNGVMTSKVDADTY